MNINPVAFLIVQNDNVKLLEASHSSVFDKIVEYIPDAFEKINGIIKRKLDKEDGNLGIVGDDFDEDDFEEDDNFDDSTDDEWEDFDDEPFTTELKETKVEKNSPANNNGEKITKKVEKKIKEVKKENKD